MIWIAALLFRLPARDVRPMHTDEAVHAVKFGALWERGEYLYDSHEYHGPTLYYFTLPFAYLARATTLAQTDEKMLRLVPALFGAGLVLLLWPLADGIGKSAALWAGIFTAISPAMVFYSRYYIQEMLLVFFSCALIVALWRFARDGKKCWIWLAAACIGVLHATKETWILAALAMLCAVPLTVLWTRRIEGKTIAWRRLVKPRIQVPALVFAAILASTLLSNFWKNPRAPLDSLRTYATYFQRGTTRGADDSEHYHAANYYFHLLSWNRFGPGLAPLQKLRVGREYSQLDGARFVWRASQPPLLWSEAFVLCLACIGILAALKRKKIGETAQSLPRFFVFYSVILAAIYCAIPYKTPWCLLGFWHGAIVLAGFGAAFLLSLPKNKMTKIAMCVFLTAMTFHTAASTRAATFSYEDDRRNPYVYAQTLRDMARLGKRAREFSMLDARGEKLLICVVAPDAWPLPWYLRRFPNVGYWETLQDVPPQALRAPLVICDAQLQPQLRKRLTGAYHQEFYGQRPQKFLVMNARADLWEKFLKERAAKPSN